MSSPGNIDPSFINQPEVSFFSVKPTLVLGIISLLSDCLLQMVSLQYSYPKKRFAGNGKLREQDLKILYEL